MKQKYLLIIITITIFSCKKKINYSEEFKLNASGKYLYSLDEIFEVSFPDNNLTVAWRGKNIRPIAINENTFTSIEMNKKFRFIEHPITKKYYLVDITESEDNFEYNYIKVEDTFNSPSIYLKNKHYKKALEGYLNIQKQDSLSVYIKERYFNNFGYELLRKKQFEDAINVFKINVALYPKSDNVYDSLGEAYLLNGDSLQAYLNYKKSLELNTGNQRAKRYIEAYNKK